MKKSLFLIYLAMMFFQAPSYVFCAKASNFQSAQGLSEGKFEYAMAQDTVQTRTLVSLILSDGPIDTPEKVWKAIKQLVKLRRVNKPLKLLLTTDYIAMVLHDAGANVNAVSKNGFTALRRARFYGHEDCVELLLAAGARW